MSKKLPPPLRLHIADEPTAPPNCLIEGDLFDATTQAFEVATGWQFASTAAGFGEDSTCQSTIKLRREADSEATTSASIEHWRAAQLADTISNLFSKIDQLQTAVWHREAELAIGVPVSPKRQGEEHLAARLEVMLRNGTDAIDCCAAGLYLLDDATSELKLRACWGLSRDRFLEPARPLAHACAELEALLGHAVVLEDVGRVPNWKTPEQFPAALCLPLMSPTDPLGTIWFFANTVRDFSDREIHLAEIIAGSIAAELQREVLLSECLASKKSDRQIVHAVQWQHDHLPTVKPLLEDWDVAGWSSTDDDLADGFYDWFVPPDGALAVALGTCDGASVASALSTSALQASVRAHAEYAHDTASMISRVNNAIWNASAGGHLGSLFYAKATPGSGTIEYSTAGTLQATLVQSTDIELICTDSLALGSEPELLPETTRLHLNDGDLLLILHTNSKRPSLQLELSRQLRARRDATAEELLQLVRSLDPQANLALILQRRERTYGSGDQDRSWGVSESSARDG